jgi:hypothetical protein
MQTQDTYTDRAATAALEAARNEHDFGGWLANVLARTAAELGSTDALTGARPGSWEADLVQRLVKGTVGWGDESLSSGNAVSDAQLDPPRDSRVTVDRPPATHRLRAMRLPAGEGSRGTRANAAQVPSVPSANVSTNDGLYSPPSSPRSSRMRAARPPPSSTRP